MEKKTTHIYRLRKVASTVAFANLKSKIEILVILHNYKRQIINT